MSKVKVHQKAAKYLQRLPKDSKARIKGILTGLEVNPLEQSHVKHMGGVSQNTGRKVSDHLLV